ncbi:RluA family pseudouridine synthase [Saccharicrinis sp. FJH54]|uniref:RluA family pseudouridine synthase n=1 Tax=Saccharicrinis sp. FJH54 TaxID=3344665 RepID=UPI0035D3DC17
MDDLNILYEDNHLIAVNKSTSDLVQGDKTGDVTLADRIKSYIKIKYNKPGDVFLGVVHRLDRPVSGVVLYARTSKALARMNKLFQDREVDKLYWAVVKQQPEKTEDKLVHWLVRNQKQNKSYAYDSERKDAKKAILSYRTISKLTNYSLLEVRLETGRHHQIRCQLAKIGSPIKGDLKYGFARSNPDGGISLHARSVTFVHPVQNKEITVVADPPENDNLWQAFLNSITQ